jgi:hypothetical protein
MHNSSQSHDHHHKVIKSITKWSNPSQSQFRSHHGQVTMHIAHVLLMLGWLEWSLLSLGVGTFWCELNPPSWPVRECKSWMTKHIVNGKIVISTERIWNPTWERYTWAPGGEPNRGGGGVGGGSSERVPKLCLTALLVVMKSLNLPEASPVAVQSK